MAMAERGEVAFGSNEVRLTVRDWLIVAAIVVPLLAFTPMVWERVEPLGLVPDYRVPYRLSSDYWVYGRWSRAASSQRRTLVVGDSVVWGHYVPKAQTLSAHLNRLAGGERFANLGADGTHPAALAGLVEHYGGAMRRRNVVLHCNLLWTSSKRHDLTATKEFAFNHPRLVPQFFPRIPCYRETFSRRLGIAIGRAAPFSAWAEHLRIAYFDNADVPTWTLDHPYRNPLRAITLRLPSPDEPPEPKPDARPWQVKGIGRFDPGWVELDASFQWASFQRSVATLRRRGNRVFVLLGPFNEHMLKGESVAVYTRRKAAVAAWLRESGVPHLVADALPTALYADASHPLGEGYALLARRLYASEAFTRFDTGRKGVSE